MHYTTLLYTTLHCTTLIALHYTALHHSTPHHNTLHSFTLHYTTLPHITLHYVTLDPLHHHKCICNYTTLITLHHNYNSTTLQLQPQPHYTTLHPAAVGEVTTRWPLQPLQPVQKTQLTAPSTFWSISAWIRSAIRDSQERISPIGFLFLKLPPPPCAVLLVINPLINSELHIISQ